MIVTRKNSASFLHPSPAQYSRALGLPAKDPHLRDKALKLLSYFNEDTYLAIPAEIRRVLELDLRDLWEKIANENAYSPMAKGIFLISSFGNPTYFARFSHLKFSLEQLLAQSAGKKSLQLFKKIFDNAPSKFFYFSYLDRRIQWLEDKALRSLWSEVYLSCRSIKNQAPPRNAPAGEIRRWMVENRESLAEIGSLDLAGMRLRKLPEEIRFFTGLTSLDLSQNRFATFPPQLESLPFLVALDLSFNFLKSLPPWMQKLTDLSRLSLTGNRLSDFPLVIGKLKNLIYLDLSKNGLRELPPLIGELEHLECLNIKENNLRHLPEEIGRLKQLSRFNASTNDLGSLPEAIGALSRLEILNLSGNSIERLPPVIQWDRLEELDCSENILSSMPALSSCRSLRKVNAFHNRLSDLPPDFGENSPLISIAISHNAFKEFPASLCRIRSLKILGAGGNGLATFPPETAWTEIEEIRMDHNEITELPPSMAAMKKLRILQFSHNKIGQVPWCLPWLPSLTVVDFSSNRLQSLPNCPWKSLSVFCEFSDNAISQLPEEFLRSEGPLDLFLRDNPIDSPHLKIQNVSRVLQSGKKREHRRQQTV